MTFPDVSQPPGPAEVAMWLQGDAVAMRNVAAQVANRWAFVRQLGEDHVGGELFRLYNVLGTLGELYYGRAAQPDNHNFDDALAPARRGM